MLSIDGNPIFCLTVVLLKRHLHSVIYSGLSPNFMIGHSSKYHTVGALF